MNRDSKYIIALDQGTSSSRAIVYDFEGNEIVSVAHEYAIQYPQEGWVEQNADDIWQSQSQALLDVLRDISVEEVASVGITNQRETVVVWHKETGEPLAPAIVWQCKRTTEYCQTITDQAEWIKTKTGLPVDPYFSASKIKWLIDHHPEIKNLMKDDQLCIGTVDSWLIFKLTGNFYTEVTNASRTMLMNLETLNWDQELLDFFGVSKSALPEIKASNDHFGVIQSFELNCPIRAVLGDQQSALFGHEAFEQNQLKCTFGTGAFLLRNIGNKVAGNEQGLITTPAWCLKSEQGLQTTYAQEGSIFVAGSFVRWFRDQLKVIKESKDIEGLAKSAQDSGAASELLFIPAFNGWGVPHWRSDLKGTVFGITADTTHADLALAGLAGVAHQLADILDLMPEVEEVKVDGGMLKNKLFCQLLANITGRKILRSPVLEMTALGAFKLARLGSPEVDLDATENSQAIRQEEVYIPQDEAVYQKKREQWKSLVQRLLA